jgi:broad specificity phosphatase PhoE
MRIIALRHGQVASNVTGRVNGWFDEELTAEGRAQAAEAAEQLDGSWLKIFSSPLRRAAETAEIIARRHPRPLILDPNLRERNFGSLHGRTWAEIEAETGRDLRHLDIELMQYDYRPWGGECVAQVIARVRAFLRSLESERQDVLVVTHGGVIKILYSLLESEPRHPILNCSAHIFYSQGRARRQQA